jgi:CubicO group peptidase (beta-lactamase class C family)
MSKESFLRVGPDLAERAYKHSKDYNQYSNGNFILLGYLIEAIANKSLAIIMKEHIFDPLGMNDTSMGASASPNIRIAHPFVTLADCTRHRVDRFLYPENSVVSAALGVHSSTRDFATLFRAMLACINDGESPLTKEVVMNMLKPEGILNNETDDRMSLFGISTSLETSTPGCRSYNRLISPVNICSTYPLGCRRDHAEIKVYYIAGAIKGYACSSYFIPKSNVFLIVFTNTTGFTDASDHISRLILQRYFNLSLSPTAEASLGLQKLNKEFGIRRSDFKKGVVDIVGMSLRAAVEGKNLLERFAREDTEKGISDPSPFQLDGAYYNELIEQTIIIEGDKVRIIGTADNVFHRFIRTGNLSIRLQPLHESDFTIDRYDPSGWKELSFNLHIGKDANNNDRVVCLSRQIPMFLDEFKWKEGASLVS